LDGRFNMNSYKKLCTEFYDIDKPSAPEDALAFYLRYAQQANGPILEPMCGSGRFLIPLLKHGFDIDGIDASPYMLDACRNNCRHHRVTSMLYEQFLHELELPRQYNLVIIPAGSFCLITEPGQVQESLRRIHAHMLSGAKFVLEIERIMMQSSNAGLWSGRWVERADGAKIICSGLEHFNVEERISQNIHRYELIRDGELLETEFEEFNIRLYDPVEFHELLDTSGFVGIKVQKPYSLIVSAETAETIVFECSKT